MSSGTILMLQLLIEMSIRCAKPPPLSPASANGNTDKQERSTRGGDKTDKETQEVTAGAYNITFYQKKV